ncbi:hypothetical protein SNE40_003384 [Patella caerulea]|uniref:Uncharacterized protein n=1 Tax=Patella caerulea TaxID=87958 RepID=A0AAN8Q8K2_PATCE
MENLLLIKVNDFIWNGYERELLLDTAVNNFLSAARRKCRIEHSEVVEKLAERTKGDVAEAEVINIDEFESISSSDDNDDGDDIDIDKIWDNTLNSAN